MVDWIIHPVNPLGYILKLDESCTSNPKAEILDWTVQFAISDFGFEMQDSSNFQIPPGPMNILLNQQQELRSGWKFVVYVVLFLILWVASGIALSIVYARSNLPGSQLTFLVLN